MSDVNLEASKRWPKAVGSRLLPRQNAERVLRCLTTRLKKVGAIREQMSASGHPLSKYEIGTALRILVRNGLAAHNGRTGKGSGWMLAHPKPTTPSNGVKVEAPVQPKDAGWFVDDLDWDLLKLALTERQQSLFQKLARRAKL